MIRSLSFAAALMLCAPLAAHGEATRPNDAEIAHIAYTAGAIDVTAGQQAIAKSHNSTVVDFAQVMVRDHGAVNEQALALVKRLGVTPQDNATSRALNQAAAERRKVLAKLTGSDFDRAYVANEVAFHKTVNGALAARLIPEARSTELKALLQTGLKLFSAHQSHAEQLARDLK